MGPEKVYKAKELANFVDVPGGFGISDCFQLIFSWQYPLGG